MGHVYDVHTSDGRVHQVETDHYHEHHDQPTFGRHLLDVIKGAVSGVLGHVVVQRFVYRGRR